MKRCLVLRFRLKKLEAQHNSILSVLLSQSILDSDGLGEPVKLSLESSFMRSPDMIAHLEGFLALAVLENCGGHE